VEVSIDTLHIRQNYLLPQNHLVKRSNEEGIQKASVEDGQTDYTTNELEVIQMLGIDAGVRVNLKGIIVVG